MYINDISQDIPQILLKHIGSHDVFRGEEIFKFVDVLIISLTFKFTTQKAVTSSTRNNNNKKALLTNRTRFSLTYLFAKLQGVFLNEYLLIHCSSLSVND